MDGHAVGDIGAVTALTDNALQFPPLGLFLGHVIVAGLDILEGDGAVGCQGKVSQITGEVEERFAFALGALNNGDGAFLGLLLESAEFDVRNGRWVAARIQRQILV